MGIIVYNRYMTTKKDPKTQAHYVNNKDFTAAVAEYVEQIKTAKEKEGTPPQMSEYIGECIYKIATRLSTRPNFINYTYRDEMICDAIENCIQYIGNFNVEKSNNAFAYITQICYYAFLRRIQKEKKQVIIKQRMIAESNYDDMTLQPGEDRDFKNQFTEFLKKNMPQEEPPKKEKKLVKKKK